MIRRFRIRLFVAAAVLGVVMAVVVSCSDPPVSELSRSRIAIANLRDVSHAEVWAPDDLEAAESAMKSAEAEIRFQGGRFGVFRDYTKAGRMLQGVIADAEAARVAAEEGKKAAESEAREAFEAALSALDHAWAALLIAGSPRERRSAGGRLDEDLSEAEQSLKEINNLITAEKYHEASAKAEKILEEVSSLIRDVRRGRT